MSKDLNMSDPATEFAKIYTMLTEIQQDNIKLHWDNLALQQHIIQLCDMQSTHAVTAASQTKSLKISLLDKFDGN